MTNQEIANEWADGNQPAPAEDVAPEANAEVDNAADDATDNATDAPTRKSWNKKLLAGVAAAVLVAGGAGYAIGTAFNDHPANSFLEERGEHFGPDGQFGPGAGQTGIGGCGSQVGGGPQASGCGAPGIPGSGGGGAPSSNCILVDVGNNLLADVGNCILVQ